MPIKKITIDPLAGAAYLQLKEGKVKKTKEFSEEVFLDFDAKNRLIGIEFLNACSGSIKKVAKKYHLALLDKTAQPLEKIMHLA